MKMVPLKAAARTEKSAKRMRRSGLIPCVVYGNVKNTLLACDEKSLRKAYLTAGESTLVELEMDNQKVPVLIHALALDPVSERMLHVDFYAVDMKKEIEAEVPLRLSGEAPAAKDHGAIIVTPVDSVTVRCLPSNLPHELAVDLTLLMEFGSTITVAQLKVPQGVVIVDEPSTVLVVAQEPRAEEVVEAPVAAATPAEGAAPAVGAPAAEGGAPEAKKEDKKK